MVLSPTKISISLLHKPSIVVRFIHQYDKKDENGEISNIHFTNRGNLIFQVVTKTEVIFYKLYVKRDLMEERGRSIESLKSNMHTLDEELVA